jgi:coenzyme F420-reducing hydrogenase gamma subunit
LLDCERELLAVGEAVTFAHFPEASSARVQGPYELSIVEGSVSTARDAAQIQRIRRESRFLVAIGACATAGGIQALRNFRDVDGFLEAVYTRPEYIDTLAGSTAIADHVPVDLELRGCPIAPYALLETIRSFLHGCVPRFPGDAVCMECKRRGVVCVMVARGEPCLGPVTHAGCGALCPGVGRGCYGCYGPKETVNAGSLAAHLPADARSSARLFANFNAGAAAFARAATGDAKNRG